MANEADFHSPLGKDALLFRRLLAREELGRLPEYRIELLRPSKSKAIAAKDLLGQKAGLNIRLADGGKRQINGLVTRFEQGGSVGRFDIYHVELRPWLWHLTLGADCRIFQDKTALEIIQAVFGEYSSATRLDNKLSGSFLTRPYTVQYRESDFNFISRLMEEEGIYYYFSHERDQHTLVLCNSPSGHSAVPGGKLAWAGTAAADAEREDVITQWSHAHTLRPLKYAHTDFAAEAPSTDLMASALRDPAYPKPNDLEVYDYPGLQDDTAMAANTGSKVAEGKRTAKLRVDAFESAHSVAAGITAHRPLAVGSTFTFEGHATEAGGYLVTSSIAEMEFAGYEANDDDMSTSYSCRFDCVPKAVAYQPKRVAQPALVRGPHTATVVGASGDEILVDKYGRVKLQFHWDRLGKNDANSSCWVRVSHPWASKQFGMVALPRVGDEVVVEFLEGNPDRPLITGRVYNATNMPPWELPAQATVSGIKTHSSKSGTADNFNELRFDDKKGKEYVWLQAEKDFHRLVKNDAYDTVRNDQHVSIVKNASLKIGENHDAEIGKQASLKIGTDTHLDIGADLLMQVKGATGIKSTGKLDLKGEAAIAITSGQAMDISVGQGAKMTATAKMDLKAGAGLSIDGGPTISIKSSASIVIEAGATLTIKGGAGSVVLGPDGVSITGPMVKINSGGSPGSGSAASAAAEASPPAPKAPQAPKENKDPLTS